MRIFAAFALIAALMAGAAPAQSATAIFAGGCFWCMEPPFDKTEGVISTTSGYMGGKKANPTYEEVSAGGSGHIEVVRIEYDPSKVSYEKLLDIYWRNVDPFDARGQFCDKGQQYRSAIFFGNEKEKALAEASKKKVAQKFGKTVATLVLSASKFYPAEDYHQNYYKKNPVQYKSYRNGCGRDSRLNALWGKAG